MMYVQVPIFSGYANIAIYPGHGTTCYMIDDVQKNQNLYSEMNAKYNTFLPFYENHHYILYPTSEGKLDDGVLYFHSEELMKKHILKNLGTEYVTGRSLTVTVSTEAAPNSTQPMAEGSGHSQEEFRDNVIRKEIENETKNQKYKNTKKSKKNKNEKKNIKNKITKKIKNNENEKKILLTSNTEYQQKQTRNSSNFYLISNYIIGIIYRLF